MDLEKFIYNRLGVRKENPKINLIALTLFLGLSNVYARISRLMINSSIPSEGPVIFISNHIDYLDPFRMYYAGIYATRNEAGENTLGRVIRAVGKSTLFGIGEPAKVRERTGKKDLLNSDNPLVRALIRCTVGWALYGAGVIPIRRGMPDRAAGKMISEALGNYQAVATSIIESRDKSGGLKGLKTGAAVLLKTHPEIPYCLVGISEDPNAVNIGKPSTYAELRRERGDLDLDLRVLTMLLADRIMELQPTRIQEAWKTGGRDTEYQTLYRHKRVPVSSNSS